MSRFHSAKVDANQAEIVKAFRDLGAYVLLVHRLKNCCDIIVVYQGETVAVEIKDGSKPPSQRKLSEGEREFMEEWTLHGGKWAKIESIDEAEGLIISIYQQVKQR